jgi:asparagine synthase (glutamine-hydrolysing)
LPRSAGVILGTLFEPCKEGVDAPRRKTVFSATETDRILSTGCRSLVTDYWGRYVAFAHDASQRRSYILRDPSGGLPCLHASFRGIDLYFSSADDCASLGILDASINWEFIATRVACDNPCTRQTAINELSAVLAGEQVEIQRGRTTRSFAWNPLQVAGSNPIEDADVAALELRRLAKACTHAWAACYRGVLHSLSGGLDSSIVLGCLRDAGSRPAITCLNYHSRGCDGDERYFARLAANHAGCALLEWERDSTVRREDMLAMERSAVPRRYLDWLQVSRREARLAREIRADAIFSGGGGDELFYRTQGILGVADYLRMRGLNRRFIEVALDAAHLENCSLWHVFREALKHRRSRSRWNPCVEASDQRKLIAHHVRARARAPEGLGHPLFESVRNVPPGKLWHAFSLSAPQEHYDPCGSSENPERVQPLLSQPLVELCLRIPTYVLASKGWDRAIARQAFSEDVPREILRRRSKQGMHENMAGILKRNIDTARELLLDGHLVSERLLDRRSVEAVLSGSPIEDSDAAREILDHLSTEVWLRSWKSPAQPPAEPARSACL